MDIYNVYNVFDLKTIFEIEYIEKLQQDNSNNKIDSYLRELKIVSHSNFSIDFLT